MPVLSGIPLYLGISQLVCIWLKFIALWRCLFVCVHVCGYGFNAGTDEKKLVSSVG